MRRIIKLFITTFFLLNIWVVVSYSQVYAYWGVVSAGETTENIRIQIGTWDFFDDPWNSDYNLNIWEDEGILNQYIPEDVVFSYNGNLYIKMPGVVYNPHYHGLPGMPNSRWAAVSIDLEWRSDTNYRVNSVVIRSGKYYIANSGFNTRDWFVSDPANTLNLPWSEWREIYPIAEEHFAYFDGTDLRDFAAPDMNYIIYK